MDLSAICEVLKATQLTDGATRKAAEEKLDEASKNSPNQLVQALISVLAAGAAAGPELRQEAAVILRQSVLGAGPRREPLWGSLEEATHKALQTQLLLTIKDDPVNIVKRSAGSTASAVADLMADDLEELTQEWPELLPSVSLLCDAACPTGTRVVALNVLKDLARTIGEGLVQKAGSIFTSSLTDSSAEVRAAGAQLVLQLVEDLEPEELPPLAPVMPSVVAAIQSLANEGSEDALKTTLQSLISAADEETDFFKGPGLQELWTTLMKICSGGGAVFADPDIRHSAMEAIMSLALGLHEDFSKAEGQPLLEHLLTLNFQWMMEVEEDVAVWTSEADEQDDDECDDDVCENAEENIDRLAETYEEEVFMPILFKVIRAAMQGPDATWKHARAAVMAICQVVEHLEDEAWIDQSVEFIAQSGTNAHPRVRYSAFQSLGQIAYDQSPYVAVTHHELLLPIIVAAINDESIRVATNAIRAFTSLAEHLESMDLEEYIKELLLRMFARLEEGKTAAMQAQAISGIAVVGTTAEELFKPYYGQVMPAVKQVVLNATGEKQRELRGKAFECVSILGQTVGKEMFLTDAHEVMGLMMQVAQAGFAPDDSMRNHIHEAAGRIAATLEKDFKPYVPALLPGIFAILGQRPTEVDPADMPDEEDEENDMSLQLVGEKIMGLKTTVLSEMQDALSLISVLIKALEDDFCEFLPEACKQLLALLQFQLAEDVQAKAFQTWEMLVICARNSVALQKLDKSVLAELVSEFLKWTVGAMAKVLEGDSADDFGKLQAQAIGVAGVIGKAGEGVLPKESVKDVLAVMLKLLARFSCPSDEPAQLAPRKKKLLAASGGDGKEEENDDVADTEKKDDDEETATRQSANFCLYDVVGTLMRVSRADFAEVGLPSVMELVQNHVKPEASEGDRGLAFYIAADVVDSLGAGSVPYWNLFMNQALQGLQDKSAPIRHHAAGVIASGARVPDFSPVVPAAAVAIHAVLSKQGEKHRRRRAVKTDAKQAGRAIDAAIRALGAICEHQETQLGAEAPKAWSLFLGNLPIKYDEEQAQRAHEQLVDLLGRGHPAVAAPEQLPKVITILADVYKTKFSTTALNQKIARVLKSVGKEPLAQLWSSISEKQQKKFERILEDAQSLA